MTSSSPEPYEPSRSTPALQHLAHELANVLDGQRREIDLTHEGSRIRGTISWLTSTQNPDGSWGPGGMASTALTVMALDRVTRVIADAQPDQPPNTELACQYLIEKYQSNLFDNAVWDTAVCGRALLTNLTETTRPVIDSIRAKLINTIGHLSNAGPHHTAQRTIFLAEAACIRDVLIASAEDLFAATARSIDFLSPYSKAQTLMASAAVYDSNPPKRYSGLLARIASELKAFLSSTSLDSANFINICASIHALSDYIDFSHRQTLRTSTASIFGESCFRENGTWYYDHLSTAWALLALTSYSIEVVIVAPYAELRSDVASITVRAAESVNKERRSLVLHTLGAALALGAAGILLAIYTVWSTLASIKWQWADWALPTAIAVFFVAGSTRLALIARNLGMGGESRNI